MALKQTETAALKATREKRRKQKEVEAEASAPKDSLSVLKQKLRRAAAVAVPGLGSESNDSAQEFEGSHNANSVPKKGPGWGAAICATSAMDGGEDARMTQTDVADSHDKLFRYLRMRVLVAAMSDGMAAKARSDHIQESTGRSTERIAERIVQDDYLKQSCRLCDECALLYIGAQESELKMSAMPLPVLTRPSTTGGSGAPRRFGVPRCASPRHSSTLRRTIGLRRQYTVPRAPSSRRPHTAKQSVDMAMIRGKDHSWEPKPRAPIMRELFNAPATVREGRRSAIVANDKTVTVEALVASKESGALKSVPHHSLQITISF